jgi:hypothetical protein
MSEVTTVGKILLKHYSPANSHSFIESKDLDKKNIGAFFSNLAEHNEDSYKKVVSDLTRLGFESATRLGSTVRLGDLLPPSFKDERFKELNKEIKSIKDKKLPKKKEDDELTNLLNKFSDTANKEIIEEGLKDNKTLAKVVKAGARGSPEQYRQTIFSPVAVNDNKGGILTDFIIDRSFAEGLTLPQYLAHTFGARQASAATKLSVAEGGFLGKQLARANMTMVIEEHDCGTHNGIPVKTNDNDYIGSFLAHPIDKYHYNNEVTSSMLGILKSKGIEEIVVRNPITCEASHDGTSSALCQLCVGIRGKGLSELNSFIGVVAGTSAAEPVAQGALNCLAEGTLVRMADYSIKAIQDIKVGDMVLGSDNAGQTSPVKVLRLFNQGLQPVNKYIFIDNKDKVIELYATENHKILCETLECSNVLTEMPLKDIDETIDVVTTNDYWVVLYNKPEYLGLIQCWDIEVDSKDALFVLANGLIVHNSKHKGGSATGSNQFGGFKYINQLFNIPDSFVHEAPIADSDGKIEEVRVAPQGGHYIVIKHDNGKLEEYYVHPDLKVLVKSGQLVEEGDVLSDGIPNPAKITKHKGIGEGRRYFSKAIKDTFETSQLGGINKRNFDIISKGLITHVKITNPKGLGNNLPDSIVNYHTLEKAYSPRTNSKKVRTDMAQGLYLEIPELHYTIGTRITSTVINELKKHNIDYVTVNETKPEFEPEMQRLLDVPAHEHDWMHTLYSTNLERRLIKAVNTGASSSLEGPSPIPGLAYAKGFGTHKFAEELEEQLSFE